MVRLLVVSDIRLYREGLDGLLRLRETLEVLGTAATASAALDLAGACRPDVVVVDVRMGGGLACIRAITELSPRMAVVAMGVGETDGEYLACAEVGVAGFVPTDGTIDELVASIESAARGELMCSTRLAASLLRHVGTLARSRAAPGSAPGLTGRELQILRLLDRHLTNKEIAQQLGIEATTVKNHVHRLLGKLRVRRRREAVASALGRPVT